MLFRSLSFQEDLCKNYTEYVSRFSSLDNNNIYYSDIISLGAKIHKISLTFETGTACTYAIELNNSLFCDPYIATNSFSVDDKKLNPYALIHVYFVQLALELGKQYVDFSILYEYKQFLGLPFCHSYGVKSVNESMNMCDVFKNAIDSVHESGKKVLVTYVCNDGAEIPIEDNMKNDEHYVNIVCPAKNSELLIDYNLSNLHFIFSLGNIRKFIKTHLDFENGDIFLDTMNAIYHSAPSFGWVNQPMSYCSKGILLEKDRAFGKKYIESIGLNAGRYILISDIKDFDYNYTKEYLGDNIVVKFNKFAYIGKYSIDYIAKNLKNWLVTDKVMLEMDLGSCTNEIAYTFALNNDFVLPLMTMWETNKLFNDDMGGKAGSTATLQKAGITDVFGLKVYDKLKNLYSEVVKDNPDIQLFGWMDVSFMYSEVLNDWVFTEFMTRFGCSNTLTIFRQMESSLTDLWTALKDKNESFEIKWYTKYSAGVDLHGVPLANDSQNAESMLMNISDEYFKLKSLETNQSFFDIVNPSINYYKDYVFSTSDAWYGVCSGLGDTPKNAITQAYLMANNVNLPNTAYKKDAFCLSDIVRSILI